MEQDWFSASLQQAGTTLQCGLSAGVQRCSQESPLPVGSQHVAQEEAGRESLGISGPARDIELPQSLAKVKGERCLPPSFHGTTCREPICLAK